MWYPSNIANEKYNTLKDFFLKSVEDFGKIKDESLLENMADFETHVRDMEFLLSKVFELPNANHEKIAVLGFDLGAISATLLQMRNANVKSLVCYDGGIMFKHNTLRLLNPSPYYDPQKLNVSALIFSRTIKNNIEMGLKENSTIFFNSPYSKKFPVRTEDMKHKFYTSYPSLGIESMPSPEPALKAYPIICEYTLNFFNYYLNGDQSDLRFLQADPKIFKEQGIYLTEDELNALGYLLLYNYSRTDEALMIFELIISEYPESANACDSLGEAYLFIRDLKQALVNYKRSLESDPGNNNAERIISQLEKLNLN
jgi:tetratricopeptide (TPR) repeat protein